MRSATTGITIPIAIFAPSLKDFFDDWSLVDMPSEAAVGSLDLTKSILMASALRAVGLGDAAVPLEHDIPSVTAMI